MDETVVVEPVSGIGEDYHRLKEGGDCTLVLTVDAPYVHVWVNGVEFRVPTGRPVRLPRAVGDFLLAQYDLACRLLEPAPTGEETASGDKKRGK